MNNSTTTTDTTFTAVGTTSHGYGNYHININPRRDGPVTVERIDKYKVDINLDDESLDSITFKYKGKKYTLKRKEFKALKGLLNL